jgi:hypothetical protein
MYMFYNLCLKLLQRNINDLFKIFVIFNDFFIISKVRKTKWAMRGEKKAPREIPKEVVSQSLS